MAVPRSPLPGPVPCPPAPAGPDGAGCGAEPLDVVLEGEGGMAVYDRCVEMYRRQAVRDGPVGCAHARLCIRGGPPFLPPRFPLEVILEGEGWMAVYDGGVRSVL